MSKKTTTNGVRLSAGDYQIHLAHFIEHCYMPSSAVRSFLGKDVAIVRQSGSSFFTVISLESYKKHFRGVVMCDNGLVEAILATPQQAELLSDVLDTFLLNSLEGALYCSNNSRDDEVDCSSLTSKLYSLLRGSYKERGKKAIIRSRVIRDIKAGIPLADGLVNYVQHMIDFAESKFKE